jgi:hypothetical protein
MAPGEPRALLGAAPRRAVPPLRAATPRRRCCGYALPELCPRFVSDL